MPSLAQTFRNAVAGLRYTLRTQRNARIHLAITLLALGLAGWLRLAAQDWAVLIVVAGLVWTAELFNTALEAAVDLATPEQHQLARVAKDVSAGAVLLAAGAAFVTGLLILGPPLLERLI